ncbi:hydrogenase maturation nickel metallochaperone HypA [bacterium]|nr:hydrogenase maturation nickel metallochaperone HypA [bacterium]
MHELSIASRVVELAAEHCRAAAARRVVAVRLRIGRLACVHEQALRFSFDLAREGTPLDTAVLHVVEVPVTVWCPTCAAERTLPGIQHFACPICGTPTGDIRAGKEIDLDSLELEAEETATS